MQFQAASLLCLLSWPPSASVHLWTQVPCITRHQGAAETVLVTMIYGRLPGEHSTATVILTNAISTSENPIFTSSEDWDQHPGPGVWSRHCWKPRTKFVKLISNICTISRHRMATRPPDTSHQHSQEDSQHHQHYLIWMRTDIYCSVFSSHVKQRVKISAMR